MGDVHVWGLHTTITNTHAIDAMSPRAWSRSAAPWCGSWPAASRTSTPTAPRTGASVIDHHGWSVGGRADTLAAYLNDALCCNRLNPYSNINTGG